MPYLIYKATNTKNGKIYIGLTGRTLAKRRDGHKCDASARLYNLPFHNALRKYGFESFAWDTLESEIPDRVSAQAKEKEFIKSYKSQDNSIGYNVTSGGDGLDPSDIKTIEKIRKSVDDYYKSENFDRTKHGKDRGGKPFNVYLGIQIQKACGRPRPRPSIWVKGEFITSFDSQVIAAESLGVSKFHMNACLKKTRPAHMGYIFEYIDSEVSNGS